MMRFRSWLNLQVGPRLHWFLVKSKQICFFGSSFAVVTADVDGLLVLGGRGGGGRVVVVVVVDGGSNVGGAIVAVAAVVVLSPACRRENKGKREKNCESGKIIEHGRMVVAWGWEFYHSAQSTLAAM